MLFNIVGKNLEQMTRLFCETISIVWEEMRTLLVLSIYLLQLSLTDLLVFLTEQAKSNVGTEVTGKSPQN